MDIEAAYKVLARIDPKVAAKFLADMKAKGEDVSGIGPEGDSPPSRPDSQLARILTAGKSHPAIRSQLTGAARREFERMMGPLSPDDIGPRRLPNGNIQIVAGCPGDYRRQLAARGGR
jgi:hypothetical protein